MESAQAGIDLGSDFALEPFAVKLSRVRANGRRIETMPAHFILPYRSA